MFNDSNSSGGSRNNNNNSPQAVIGNVYCVVSALFFATCAYAQLNDPAPALWVAAYLGGGTVPNLLVTSLPPKTVSTISSTMNITLTAFAALMVLAILQKMVSVAPKLLEEFRHDGDTVTSASVGAVLWAFLEHEEGRDSSGLLLLILHVMYLKHNYLKGDGPNTTARGGRGGATLLTRITPILLSLTLIGVLGGAVYAWLVHHPNMVAKYKLPHCQGGMFGRDGSEL